MANREDAVRLMLGYKWASGEFDKVLAFYNTLNYSLTDQTTEATLARIWDGIFMHKCYH